MDSSAINSDHQKLKYLYSLGMDHQSSIQRF